MPKGWKLGRSGVRLHNFTFFSISVLDLMIKSFSLCLPVNTFVIVSKIGTCVPCILLYLPLNTLVTVELPISSRLAISLFDKSVNLLRNLMNIFLISNILLDLEAMKPATLSVSKIKKPFSIFILSISAYAIASYVF